MTTPSIVPVGYNADDTDFNKVKRDTFGALRSVAGTVSVPSGTAAASIVGLVPFQKGATFTIGDKSVYAGNFGAGTTTVDLGIVYEDSTLVDVNDAFAAASAAPQSGGFIAIDEKAGLTLTAEANGWLAVTINTAAADATADIEFNVGVSYDA